MGLFVQYGPLGFSNSSSSSSWYVVNVGGNWSNGSNAGLAYANYNGVSNANANIGSRLLVHHFSMHGQILTARWKYRRLGQGLVGLFSKGLVGEQGVIPVPKKVGFLYEWMCNKERIRKAIHVGAIGKRERCDVAEVLVDEDAYVEKVYDLLVSHTFQPQNPRKKDIYDKSSQKWRSVEYVRFFPDGIIHTLIVMAMQPVMMRGMYAWCCASVPGRGGSAARKYVRRAITNDPKGTKYACKMDVHHYYHSVNRKRLIWALARKIKDKKFLKLIWDILQTCEQGLAIGYFICQWLANFYLEPLDHYIMTLPGVKYMVRYMDDIVIMGPNKKQLHRARRAIAEFMEQKLDLKMKSNWQVFPLKARPLDFVGYRFYRTHTTMRRKNFLRFTRQCRRAQKKIAEGRQIGYHMAASLLSRAGQLVHCDGHKSRVKYLDPVGIKILKEVVRRETQRRQRAAQLLYRGAA